jgi:hypothetical protein
MTQLPSVGSTVSVEVRNVSAFAYPASHVFEGQVVPSPSWLVGEHLSLTTHIPTFPVRMIPVDRILKIGQTAVSFGSSKPTNSSSEKMSWTVKGSKGDTYVVSRKNHGFVCSCIAGGFGRACKHVKQIQAELAGK